MLVETKEIIIGTIGIIGLYILIKYLNNKKPAQDLYSEIVNNKKYQVKGQWEK